jgi:hypothetical protein
LYGKISKLLRCIKTQQCNGVSGEDGTQALDPLGQWLAQVPINANQPEPHLLLADCSVSYGMSAYLYV